MVARIASGKSIRGILNYNENKVRNAEAQLLMATGFSCHHDELSFKSKLERFEMLTRQNERTQTNALHITLNFSRQDMLDDELLNRIATDYMDAIGFGRQPFLVYRHYDASHPHIHIATVNIADGGERIETHNIGKHQSEKARREIEIRYNLVKAEDQKKEMGYLLRSVKLEKQTYGKAETKSAISGIVREVTGSYKFTSLAELNAALRQFNVLADSGQPESRMHEKGGLTYHLLNEDGEKVGVPIKASSIYGSPTLKNLEKRYVRNKEERKPYALRLKHLLDKSIREAKGMTDLQARLQQQGIRILLRENAMGNIYGVTFIDNATRTVFNGSSLGKSYGAKAFMERAALEKDKLRDNGKPYANAQHDNRQQMQNVQQVIKSEPFPAYNQPVIETLWDIALSDQHEIASYDPYRKKRKKKRLQQE